MAQKQDLVHIVCYQTPDRGIGRGRILLYRLLNDMRHFRQTTEGHVVLMGRKTFATLHQPLENRVNVVLTRHPELLSADVYETCHIELDIDSALVWCRENHPDKIVFVIGGGEIYQQTLDRADRVIATEVAGERTATAFYPEMEDGSWVLTEEKTDTSKDLATGQRDVPFVIKTFCRKR